VGYPGDYEADEVARKISGLTWEHLLHEMLAMDESSLLSFHSAYHYLTPMAFHYYLPAFMNVSLDPVEADIVCEYLMFALEPSPKYVSGDGLTRWFAAFTSLVTPEQNEVIRSFILYVHDASRVLMFGDVTESENLRKFWFPEGFPKQSEKKLD
jgi:hypothetical protein